MKSIFTLVLVLMFFSCEKECSSLNYEKYSEDRGYHPIEIQNQLAKCEYEVEINIEFQNSHISEMATLRIENRVFELGLLNGARVALFDLDQQEGFESQLNIRIGEDVCCRSVLEKIHIKNDNKVYQFRWPKASSFQDYQFDLVFFVTLEDFIIGSYVSTITKDSIEFYSSPSGDILKDVIDYSKKELRRIG